MEEKIDKAIADVRKRASLWVQHDEMQTMVSREFAESLRMLADAVEELRGDYEKQREYADEQYRKALAAEAERDHWRELTEAREDENVRLAAQVADLEEDRAISARMYRILRDAVDAQQKATEEVDKLWEEHKRRMDTRATKEK